MAASELIYVGIKGAVVALDRKSGAIRWTRQLKGVDFVNIVSDDASLYASTRGEIFCLEPATGLILWHNPLKGFGTDLASLLIGGAEIQQMFLLEAKRRREQQAAAAAAASTSATGG